MQFPNLTPCCINKLKNKLSYTSWYAVLIHSASSWTKKLSYGIPNWWPLPTNCPCSTQHKATTNAISFSRPSSTSIKPASRCFKCLFFGWLPVQISDRGQGNFRNRKMHNYCSCAAMTPHVLWFVQLEICNYRWRFYAKLQKQAAI